MGTTRENQLLREVSNLDLNADKRQELKELVGSSEVTPAKFEKLLKLLRSASSSQDAYRQLVSEMEN